MATASPNSTLFAKTTANSILERVVPSKPLLGTATFVRACDLTKPTLESNVRVSEARGRTVAPFCHVSYHENNDCVGRRAGNACI